MRHAAPLRSVRPRTLVLTAASGAALILASLVLLLTSRSSEQPAINPGVPTALAAGTPDAAAPTRPHRAAAASAPPDRLAITSLGIDARVVPVGVTASSELAIPEDVRTLGWYRYGASPGDPAGSIVIAGHVDSAVAGLGALFPLRNIAVSAVITVSTTDGRQWRYRVVGRQYYPKAALPRSALFSAGGSPRLTLLTCGGPFDRETRSYQDNLVVTAVPAD